MGREMLGLLLLGLGRGGGEVMFGKVGSGFKFWEKNKNLITDN